MTKTEAARIFGLFNHTLSIKSTKDIHYERGFIIDPRGVTLGRMTIIDGCYDHIKWYWRAYGPIDPSDFIINAWALYLSTGNILTKERWKFLIRRAKVLQRKDYEKKLEWRNAHPGKKRKGLKYKNIRMFL